MTERPGSAKLEVVLNPGKYEIEETKEPIQSVGEICTKPIKQRANFTLITLHPSSHSLSTFVLFFHDIYHSLRLACIFVYFLSPSNTCACECARSHTYTQHAL